MSENGEAAGRGGSGLLTAGIVIAGVIAAGLYLGMRDSTGPTQEELSALVAPGGPESAGQVAPEDAVQDPAPADRPVVPKTAPDEPVAKKASESPGGTTAPTADAADAPDPVVPVIDEVRVDGDGILIVAGRAAPGSTVRILVDGVQMADVVADTRGAFATVSVIGPDDTARVLTLESTDGGVVVASAGEIILAPLGTARASTETPDAAGSGDVIATLPETDASPQSEGSTAPTGPTTGQDAAPAVTPDTADPASAASESDQIGIPGSATPEKSADLIANAEPAAEQTTEPGAPAVTSELPGVAGEAANTPAPAAGQTAPAQIAEAPQVPAPASPGEPPASTQPVAVLKSDAGGVTLLDTAPAPPDSIQLDTIGYSNDGVVQLSGRAGTEAREVRIYLDNRAVLSLPMDAAGGWRGEVPDIDAGVYTLRVDAVSADGQVTSRIETPFKREEAAVLARGASGQEGPVRAITVQTGDTLWAIARDRYGEGLLYVRVFEANRSSIRDPDLIYPGQVFDLPVEN